MKARFALLLLAASTAAQAEIFQWKDENGRIHFGEEVPAKYQKAAKQVETGKLNTMPAQKTDARPPTASTPEGPAAEAPAAVPPPTAQSDSERCAQAMARYQESQACFARFRIANGAVRPEAFPECETVTMPSGCAR
jgi:hypothetical protein